MTFSHDMRRLRPLVSIVTHLLCLNRTDAFGHICGMAVWIFILVGVDRATTAELLRIYADRMPL